MHTRNISIIALLIAVPVTAAVTFVSAIHRSDALGIFYFPAIVLSVIFSGITPSPGPIAVWSSAIAYTVIYLIVFVIVYALLLEVILMWPHAAKLKQRVLPSDMDPSSSQLMFEAIGGAIRDVESRRRTHWVLDDAKEIDLAEPAALVGAKALAGLAMRRPANALLKSYRKQLVNHVGAATAEATMQRLKEDAVKFVREATPPTREGDPPTITPTS